MPHPAQIALDMKNYFVEDDDMRAAREVYGTKATSSPSFPTSTMLWEMCVDHVVSMRTFCNSFGVNLP